MKQAGIKITYAGVDITQWMYVQMVKRDVGTNHVNTMQKVGISDGQMLQYMSRDVKPIVVTGIVMNDDLVPLRRSLAAAIDTDEPQQLIFGDEPDKYYLAIVDSQPTFTEGFRSGTISISFVCPDGGIAHSVATKTFNNTPYKDMPVNFAIASHASSYNQTQLDTNVIYMSLSEDLSGKTITTSAKVIVTNYKGKVDPNNGGGPYIAIQDGMSTGNWDSLINPINVTGNGVYTSVPKTMTKHSLAGTRNDIGIQMYNLNATIEVWVKLGTTASPWSPNPADPEYYTNTITVHNGGTYPVEPVITATMHADNGLIALINGQGGVLQFGNPEEADGVERKRSEVARYEGFDKEPAGVAYNTGQTNSHYYYIKAQKNVMEGSVKYADDDGSAVEPVFLPTNSYYWEGPSLHLKTTNASNGSNTKSFIAKWRYKFNSNVSALGAIEMTLDNDTGVAYEVIIRSNYAGKDDVDVQVFAGSTLVFQQTLNRSVFSNGRYYEAKLTKLGNTLNLQLAGIVQGGIKPSEVITRTPPLIMPPIALTPAQASIPITGTTLWFQRFENYPYPDMGVYDMDIEWLNVDYWTDLKNRFGAGDVVTIDVANRAVYVNGVPDSTLHTIGNEWSKFRFNPGDTLIQTVQSSWAQPFACEVALREAWL
ncbi:phage tail fiber protein [Lacticaseibacillus paracasei]|uniref:distal tail protein Dit n=1 Tax=Lacticaseibacillus paracasei TaxID=1597 RepID=UPI001063E6FF|nr:distal tail protein Dit [Lacticaseibacillus paracasei]TEA91106.1 phage tail fiber protein [Lacticaseibacillus paracasei]TEA93463.1 phage tail fiber protein [Lacticaseibacillus paracasei]